MPKKPEWSIEEKFNVKVRDGTKQHVITVSAGQEVEIIIKVRELTEE